MELSSRRASWADSKGGSEAPPDSWEAMAEDVPSEGGLSLAGAVFLGPLPHRALVQDLAHGSCPAERVACALCLSVGSGESSRA